MTTYHLYIHKMIKKRHKAEEQLIGKLIWHIEIGMQLWLLMLLERRHRLHINYETLS